MNISLFYLIGGILILLFIFLRLFTKTVWGVAVVKLYLGVGTALLSSFILFSLIMAAVYFFYDDNDPAMIVIFPLFTLIISIPCLILFGTPTYLILKRIKRASLGAMIIIGMIGSTIIMSSITQENSWVFILISASLGLFYAASYWWGAEKLGKENKANEQ